MAALGTTGVAIATRFAPLQAMKIWSVGLAAMLRTTPPPEGIGIDAKRFRS